MPAYSPINLSGVIPQILQGVAQERLQRELAREFAADRVLLTDSGTSALRLAIELAGRIRPDGSRVVALPAFGCYALVTAAIGAGCRLAFYDIDPATLAPDLVSLETCIQRGAGVVVVAPVFGVPVDWYAIEAVIHGHDAVLLEDAAQGHGARYDDRPLGSLGSLSVLSFGRGKGWTGASGGALLTRGVPSAPATPRLPHSSQEARIAAAIAAQWSLGRPWLYGVPASLSFLRLGSTEYIDPWEPMGMSHVAAATALAGHAISTQEASERRMNARRLIDAVRSTRGVAPALAPAGTQPGYIRLPVRLERPTTAAVAAAARLGIQRTFPLPLPRLPAAMRNAAFPGDRFAGADSCVAEYVTIPVHSRVSSRDIADIVRLLSGARTTLSQSHRHAAAATTSSF